MLYPRSMDFTGLYIALTVAFATISGISVIGCLLAMRWGGNRIIATVGILLLLVSTPCVIFWGWAGGAFLHEHLLFYKLSNVAYAFAVTTSLVSWLSVIRLPKGCGWVFAGTTFVIYSLAILISFYNFLGYENGREPEINRQVLGLIYVFSVCCVGLTIVMVLLGLWNKFVAHKCHEPPKPDRRWFQFKLRTLLIFVTVAAALFGSLASWSYKAHQQMKAVNELRKLRAAVGYHSSLPGLSGVGRHYFAKPSSISFPFDPKAVLPKVRDSDLMLLKDFTALNSLFLSGTSATDAGLDSLKGLTNLQRLYLENVQVTDAGLEHLQSLTNLRELNLRNTKVGDAGLEQLKGLTALQRLDVSGTQVTEDGVERLQKALPNCSINYDNRTFRRNNQ